MAATAAKKMSYEFTIDDDELSESGKSSTDQGTMCNFYKLNLPASASILSKQIAKSQAKRAKKEERHHRRRVDLSTVREQDEPRGGSASSEPIPEAVKPEDVVEAPESVAAPYLGRSRIDSAPLDVKLKRQVSLPEEERKKEPVDEEEAVLLAMLFRGIEQTERKFSLQNQNQMTSQPMSMSQIPPSPGLPRVPPTAKVSEWLLERSTSPDNVSVVSSMLLEDAGLNYQNSENGEEDVFFDAEEVIEEQPTEATAGVENIVNCGLEHDMQGLSLNRNMAAMTQSLVRVEEETTTTDGMGGNHEIRTGRSTSVSPRPTNDQFIRNSNGSATFNVKHSSTLARLQKLNNGNLNSTPVTSRTTRSVLRVHNVNATPGPRIQTTTMTKSVTINHPTNQRASSGIRGPDTMSTPPQLVPKSTPPTVTINPSTPSRPASVASSIRSGGAAALNVSGSTTASNFEGLQDLIQMQEEALRKAALDGNGGKNEEERKMSWHSDQDANRQSTSTHSSLGSLCSSKSIDGAHALNKVGGATVSRIPTPRSRLPTPRGSNLPKRVHSVASAMRHATSKPEPSLSDSAHFEHHNPTDECF